MKVAIYSRATGDILRSVSVSADAWKPGHDVGDSEAFQWVPEDATLAGKRIVGGRIVDAPDRTDMALARHIALRRVDSLAGRERQDYVTVAPGQDLIYAAKRREVAAWIATGRPDTPDAYPAIAASATGAGVSFPVEAAAVEIAVAQWDAIAPGLEDRRAAAKRAIRAATTPADIDTAIDSYRSMM